MNSSPAWQKKPLARETVSGQIDCGPRDVFSWLTDLDQMADVDTLMTNFPGIESPGKLVLFGGPMVEFGPKRTRLTTLQGGILALLATHGSRGVQRSDLVLRLWDRGRESTLRRRLSQAIYALSGRLGLGELVLSDGDLLFLNNSVMCSDLGEFLTALRDRAPTTALQFVSRGFLRDLDPTPSRALEEWIAERRVRYRADLRSLALEIWAEGANRSDWRMAEDAARALVGIDSFDKEAVRKLAIALTLQRRSDEAEAALRAHAELVHREEPPHAVEHRVSEAIGQVREATRELVGGRLGRGQPAISLGLVGRNEELQALRTALRPHRRRSELHVVNVSGAAGVGKTRLVCEVLPLLPFDGVRAITGRCGEIQRNLPLSPLLDAIDVDWILQLAGSLEEPWSSVFSELLHRARPSDPPLALTRLPALGDGSRRLVEAFRRLFHEATRGDPLILFIDDFHWIDETSILVLDYLRRRWGEGDWTLCVTSRPTELSANVSAASFLQSVDHSSLLTVIDLKELPVDEATQLVLRRAGRSLDSTTAERIVRGTGGVPFFLLEAASHWGTRPVEPTSRHRLSLQLAPSLSAALDSRISGLSRRAYRVLEVIAASGKEIDGEFGPQVSRLSLEQWVTAVEELESAEVVRWSARGIMIRHDLLRDFIVERISEARWRGLNLHIARLGLGILSAGELSFHYLHAGKAKEAIELSAKAADEASVAGAYAEALRFLERACDLEMRPAHRAVLLSRLALAAFKFQRLEEACIRLPQAISASASIDNASLASECQLALIQCEYGTGRVPTDLAVRQLQCLQGHAVSTQNDEFLAKCLEAEAKVLALSDSPSRIGELLARAEDALPRTSCVAGRVQLACLLALHALYGDPQKGVQYGRLALGLCNEQPHREDLYLLALSRRLLSLVSLGEADSQEGVRTRRELAVLLQRGGDFLLTCHHRINEASWNLDKGLFDTAAQALSPVVRELEDTDAVEVLVRAQTNLGTALLRAGAPEEALPVFREAERRALARTSSEIRLLIASGLALALLRSGKLSEAAHRPIPEQFLPDSWTADPTLFAEYLFEKSKRNGQVAHTMELIHCITQDIRERFVVHWIDLIILTSHYSLHLGQGFESDSLHEAKAHADRLKLVPKSRALEILLARK